MDKRILISLCLIFYFVDVFGESHYCYEARSRSVTSTQVTRKKCGFWGWSRCVRYVTTTTTQTYSYRKCCSGWSGTICNRPICSPRCNNQAVCYDVNSCYCRPGSAGSTCSIPVYCSLSQDCYPGTCFGTNQCRCSSAFQGTSCQTLRDGGLFERCDVSLVDSAENTYETSCNDPNVNRYSNASDLRTLRLNWVAKWELPDDVPPAPAYVIQSRPGVIDTYAQVKLYNAGGSLISNFRQECGAHAVSAANPFYIVECLHITPSNLPDNVQHLHRLEVQFFSQTGGFKRIRNPTTFQVEEKPFTGISQQSDVVEVVFDFASPVHCSQNGGCQYQDLPALDAYPDNIQGDEIDVQIFGWEDEDSGLSEYRVMLYSMAYNPATQKLELDDVIQQITWHNYQNNPIFTVNGAGVYSIVMEVMDIAGNIARARTLVVTEENNNVEIREGASMLMSPSTVTDTGVWIPDTGDLEMEWTDVFINRHHVNNHLLAQVERLVGSVLDDDRADPAFGNRTIYEIASFDGVVRFDVGYKTVSEQYYTYVTSDERTEHYVMTDAARQDGDHIQIIVDAYDVTDFTNSFEVSVFVDSSPPELAGTPEVTPNVDSGHPDIYYASSVSVGGLDRHSGIKEMDFVLRSTELIHAGTQRATQYSSNRQRECTSTGQCYCTAFDACYDRDQTIWLDNCWFKDHMNQPITIQLTVHNTANLITSNSYPIGPFADLDGIGLYPEPEGIATTRNRRDEVELFWYLPPSCYPYDRLAVIYTQDGQTSFPHFISPNTSRIVLPGVKLNSQFDLMFRVEFTDGTVRETEPVSFSTDFSEPDAVADAFLEYSCSTNSPCVAGDPNNPGIVAGITYYSTSDPGTFISCGAGGTCFELPCPAGLVWDQSITTCNFP